MISGIDTLTISYPSIEGNLGEDIEERREGGGGGDDLAAIKVMLHSDGIVM